MTQTNPLNWQTPIVNSNGTPTASFMRQWLLQQQANAKIPALANVFVDTAAPLSGGGTLGSGKVTLTMTTADFLTALGASGAKSVLDLVGSTRGAILYRGASGWAILAPGAAGAVLTSQGAGADPHWV